jgi:hypothetical protein
MYEKGKDPTSNQMGEFLEYLRQQHFKNEGGGLKRIKRLKPRDQRLDGDSVSDITDLSKDGILVSSMHKLSAKEQKKLNKLT